MSRTIRKNKLGEQTRDGAKCKTYIYICRCSYCVGVDKNNLIEKISKRELNAGIIEHEERFNDCINLDNFHEVEGELDHISSYIQETNRF